jgi:hypothetical protein
MNKTNMDVLVSFSVCRKLAIDDISWKLAFSI